MVDYFFVDSWLHRFLKTHENMRMWAIWHVEEKKQNSAKTELNSSFKVSIPQAPCPGKITTQTDCAVLSPNVFEALYVSPPLWPKDTNMFDAFDPEKDRTLWLFVEGYALSHI